MLRIPTPYPDDLDFHAVMVVRYSNSGLPFFAKYHRDIIAEIMRLKK